MSQGRGEGPGRVTHGRGSRTWGDGGSLGGGLFAGGWGARVSATQVVNVVGQRAKGATGSLSSRTRWRWPRRDCPAAQPLQERMHRPDHRIFQSETWLDAIQLGAAAPPPWRLGPCFQERLTPPSRCPSLATGGGAPQGVGGPSQVELTAPTPTPGALPQVTSLPNSRQNSLLFRAGRGPTHEPFTPQRHSRIPHQTLRWPTPQFRVTKDGSPHRQAPRPGVQAPLQRPLCHSGVPRTLAC